MTMQNEWLDRAQKGDCEAQFMVGYSYLTGEDGFEQSMSKALDWLEKSANQGYIPAQHSMGIFYFQILRNEKEALPWFEKAAKQGNANSMTFLGILYSNGEDIPHDDRVAAFWLKKACEDHDFSQESKACGFLASLYLRGAGVPRSAEEAHKYLLRAIKAGGDGSDTAAETLAKLEQALPHLKKQR